MDPETEREVNEVLDNIKCLDDFNFEIIFGKTAAQLSEEELEQSVQFKKRFSLEELKEMYRVKRTYSQDGDDMMILSVFRRYMDSERARYLKFDTDGRELSYAEVLENCMDEAEYFMRQAMFGFYKVGDEVLGDVITAEEKEKVDIIKKHFFNEKDGLELLELKESFNGRVDDVILYRYLRAYDGDVEAAEYNWRKCMRWRARRLPGLIPRSQIYESLKSGKCFYFGVSKKKNLTLHIFSARHFPNSTTLEESVNFGIWLIEYGTRLLRDNDELADRVNIMYDRKDFGYANFDVWLVREMGGIVRFYPEALQTFYILRANWFYNSVFQVSKSLLPTGVQNRIRMVYDMNELKEEYDEGQLLRIHGGTSDFKFDPDVDMPEPTEEELKPWLRFGRERRERLAREAAAETGADAGADGES